MHLIFNKLELLAILFMLNLLLFFIKIKVIIKLNNIYESLHIPRKKKYNLNNKYIMYFTLLSSQMFYSD